MKTKLVFLSVFLSICSSSYASDSCSLKIGEPTVMHSFGVKNLVDVDGNHIWFGSEEGDLAGAESARQDSVSTTFNYNTLYRLSNEKGDWYFRFPGAWFDEQKTKRTVFYSLQWSNGSYPPSGKYKIDSINAPRPQTGNKTFTTIGDSMTWFKHGQYFRCILSGKLPDYRFIGSYTDSFGFGHEGHGGDSTGNIVARVKDIPSSDVYFLMAGANDVLAPNSVTVNNIKYIVSKLLSKNLQSHVFVSTITLRTDKYVDSVPGRNNAIRRWYKQCKCHDRVTLIDTEKMISRIPGMEKSARSSDGLHPSKEGYYFISSLIANAVNKLDAQKLATGGQQSSQ